MWAKSERVVKSWTNIEMVRPSHFASTNPAASELVPTETSEPRGNVNSFRLPPSSRDIATKGSLSR